MSELSDSYAVIRDLIPSSEIWSGVTLFSEKNSFGSIYEDIPFKDKNNDWFYKANQFIGDLNKVPLSRICSHGLYHADHSRLNYDAQQMSILGSCKYLNSNIFIPPFNRYNEHTEFICDEYDIKLIRKEGWKSLEFESFDPEHKLWYWHSWRISASQLKRMLSNAAYYSSNLG